MNANSTQWQRLSPIALVYFVLHFLMRFIKDGLLNAIPPFAVLLTQVENKLLWFSVGAAGLIAAVVIYALLFYLFFQYRITDNEVLLQRGVIKKQQLNLNFTRIQNVNLAAPFYFSPFNLVNVQLDAAGSKGQEVVLAGIDKPRAEQLRDVIFSSAQNRQDPDSEEEQQQTPSSIFTLRNIEVAKFGLFSSTVLIAFAFVAPFYRKLEPLLIDHLITPVSAVFDSFLNNQQLALTLASIAVGMSIILLITLVSSIAALLRFYNFELFTEEDKIKRISGLLERAQFSLQKSRIQSIDIKQNWIAKLLGRYTVTCKQIGNSTPNKAQKDQSLVIPVLSAEQLTQALNICRGEALDVKTMNYECISIRYFYKNLGLFVLLPAVIAALLLVNQLTAFKVASLMGFVCFGASLCYLRFKRYGYSFSDELMVIRTGFIGISYKVFSAYKVQKVRKLQTPMMARHKLATVKFALASGTVGVPYLPQDIVMQQLNICSYLAESSNKSWM